MWQRRILRRFLLPRVSDSNIAGTGRRIERNSLKIKGLLGCELRKRKMRNKRKITQSNMKKVRKTRRISGENRVSDRNVEFDRISLLPDPIVHIIYSSLRCAKDVARTTILSKNWKRAFDSYNSFDFDQRWFRVAKEGGGRGGFEEREAAKENFKEYVERSIATRLDGVQVEKFRLYVDYVDAELMIRIFQWIRAAMAQNVKELDVNVSSIREIPLPVVLTELGSITFLKVSGNSLGSLVAMKMPNLKGILIKDAKFLDVNVIKKLEENCPSLEDLRLVNCPKLTHLQICSLVKLKRVEVQDCPKVKSIEIASTNLETLWYHGRGNQKCKINLLGSENVKNLTLRDRTMTDSAFEDCILSCPLLENLVLLQCHRIETLRICKLALKRLSLIQCVKLGEVDIDAPQLYSFEYDGRVMPFSSIKAPRLSEVKLSFNNYNSKKSYYKDENFSWNFDGSKGLKLVVYTKQFMKIFEEPRESDLLQKDILKLELTPSSSKVVKTVDNWLRNFHGKRLVLASSNGELLKLVNTLVIDREDNPSCCEFYSNKCWRHYIEGVKVSTLESAENTSFNFTWRSRKKVKRSKEEDNDK